MERLLKKFRHYIKYFLFKNINKLPPHRPWDYKIKIIFKKQTPYYKNRPLFLIKFKYIKK